MAGKWNRHARMATAVLTAVLSGVLPAWGLPLPLTGESLDETVEAGLGPSSASSSGWDGAYYRASVSATGAQGNADSTKADISDDGRRVLFMSGATNLVPGYTPIGLDFYLHDLVTGSTTMVGRAPSTQRGAISGSGRYVVWDTQLALLPADTNSTEDVYITDTATGVIELISQSSGGAVGDRSSLLASVSDDGRYVAFQSAARNLVTSDSNGKTDVFVRDRLLGTTVRASVTSAGTQANHESLAPRMSGDGRFVVFHSSASNLVAGDTNGWDDVFRKDLTSGQIVRVSLANGGGQGNQSSHLPAVSDDGTVVAFLSVASNLVSGITDTNNTYDVFRRDVTSGVTTRVNPEPLSGLSGVLSQRPALSDDGEVVAFTLSGSLLPQDQNGAGDVYAFDESTSTVQLITAANSTGLAAGGSEPAANGDGRFVLFETSTQYIAADSGNLGDVYVRDREVDLTPPAVIGVPDGSANGAGWYDAPVTIDWQATDPPPSSGTPTDPPDTVAAIEGANVSYTSAPSCDPAGNCATGSLALSIDLTPPDSTIATGGNPVIVVSPGGPVTGTALDNLSGVAAVTLVFANATASSSQPATLTCSPVTACSWTSTAPLAPGLYTLTATASDVAGHADPTPATATVLVSAI